MAEIKTFVPKGGLSPEQFVTEFLKKWGLELKGVVIMAQVSDGNIVSGWSASCQEDVPSWVGIMESVKLDFWNCCWNKRCED